MSKGKLSKQYNLPCHCFQIFCMLPTSPQSAIAQSNHYAHCDHASISRFLRCRSIDECAETSMIIVDEIYQVLFDSMQSRWQALVFYHPFQLNPRQRSFPSNCVTGFDVEIDQEQGRDGREIIRRSIGHFEIQRLLASSDGGHGVGCWVAC